MYFCAARFWGIDVLPLSVDVNFGSASGRFTAGDEDYGFYDNTGAIPLSLNDVELAHPDFDTDDDGVPDADEPCFCWQIEAGKE